jgi:hypothetical protein
MEESTNMGRPMGTMKYRHWKPSIRVIATTGLTIALKRALLRPTCRSGVARTDVQRTVGMGILEHCILEKKYFQSIRKF